MAKTNTSTEYEFMVTAPGTITVEGVVNEVAGDSVIINKKRDGSSLREIVTIARETIILVRGTLEKGEVSTITYMSPVATVGRKLRRCTLEGNDPKTGMLKGADENGKPFLVRSLYAKIKSTSEVEAPPSVEAKKKKSSSKDKEKKK